MKGSAAIEYILLLLAAVGLLLPLYTTFLGDLAFVRDVKNIIVTKFEGERLKAYGLFLSSADEGNVVFVLRGNGTFFTEPLTAIVNLSRNYDVCGDVCKLAFDFSFDVNEELNAGTYRVVKESGEVRIE